MRRHLAGRGDHKFFKRTASRSKDVNLGYVNYRGGIRF